jgi:hypothetical protein
LVTRRGRGRTALAALVAGVLIFPLLAIPGQAFAATSGSDNFNRADGALGSNWTDMTDGGLAISSQMVIGTNAGGTSGDIRTAETYASDQYSQVTVTSTPLSGTQWIGPMVRAQNGGQSLYVGIYYWNNGSQQLMLFKRINGQWAQLGQSYASGPLAAGTVLSLSVVGSSLSFSANGVVHVTASDTAVASGAPGIMANGTATAGNWAGGTAVQYTVGGTVAGLTGTVVLQDNARDNLSVSANGQFTFPTSLAAGANYNVTVLTNPSGQFCTVSNGLGTIGTANVTSVAVSCTSQSTTGSGSDDFNRPDGPLGPNWTAVSDGALAISSQVAIGTNAGGVSGDVRTAETYTSDQYSQVTVTSTPLTGTQWIGPAVRAQNGGQSLYAGIYYWNNAIQQLMLFKRVNGSWGQLGPSYACGPLAAGTLLTLSVVGNSLSFSANGVVRITATDSDLAGGAPGIMANGTATADNWAGGNVAGTYSIGGTVSGLSGTVVLQNNGGDDLSVSANGTFTFATKLAPNTTFSVSVETYPTGQVCTVTSGSGPVASANVTSVAVTCVNQGTTGSGSDNFNRADGPLGPSWTSMSDGGMAISSQMVIGTNAGGSSGDIRTAEAYASDQYSQVLVTSTPLSGRQWIGPVARAQNAGQSLYVGIYFWNNGKQQLMLFKRISGNWTQLGGAYASGPLAAGTVLSLSVIGSHLSFSANGVVRVTATDSNLASGAPGIMANGTATAENWAGGNVSGTYSVGGTVSGTSGTVVLQDNGADDLSVSANGSFTFATLLAAGSNYNVTVKTNPPLQNCFVSNGLGTIGSASVTNVAVSCSNQGSGSSGSGTDNFNRLNGPLGPNWADMSDGGMAISNQMAIGTNASGTSGDIRTAEIYTSNQYSQVTITSTPLSGTQWIGPVVRAQNGGQNLYAGIYYWNNGNQQLMLFKRNGGGWAQLGSSYPCGPLTAGTQVSLSVVGTTLALTANGVLRVTASDSSVTGGAPGIMANGTATASNWSGGTAGFQVYNMSTDANGVQTYDAISANNGYGAQAVRVLRPTHPAAGVAHNFLFVLPVEPGLGTTWGDGLATLQQLDAEDQYNVTIIEPSFGIDPWYANNPNDPNLQYETFMVNELAPWVKANLATTRTEQNWLIGFSKSGIGDQDLILKHPDVFGLAAAWDFPADMNNYNQFGTSSANAYGTQANFASNYQLTGAFLDAHRAPFLTKNRIWIGGYNLYGQDVTNYDALLSSEGIPHTTGPSQLYSHRWDSGWVPVAMAALYQDSTH